MALSDSSGTQQYSCRGPGFDAKAGTRVLRLRRV